MPRTHHARQPKHALVPTQKYNLNWQHPPLKIENGHVALDLWFRHWEHVAFVCKAFMTSRGQFATHPQCLMVPKGQKVSETLQNEMVGGGT